MEVLLDEVQRIYNAIDMAGHTEFNRMLKEIFLTPEVQNWIKDTIKWDQLYDQGITEDNVIIGYYSPYTESLNPEKVAGTHYTMRDTGDFFASMKIYVLDTAIVIDAEGEKDDTNLFEKYNYAGNLLGLTESNMDLLSDKIKPLLLEKLWKFIEA